LGNAVSEDAEKNGLAISVIVKSLFAQLERMGVSTKLFHDTVFEAESDWAFVIRLHTIIEATLNHLIVKHFADERLFGVVSELDVSDQRRGKLAFVKALDLLPKPYRAFVKQFSEIRNELVHDIKNLDFDLKTYMAGPGKDRRKNLSEALQAIFPNGDLTKALIEEPRMTIMMGATGVIVAAGDKQPSLGAPPSISTPKEQ
jgi:hypothetical protein